MDNNMYRLYLDHMNGATLEGDEFPYQLPAFLEQDVQSSNNANNKLRALDEVERGLVPSWGGVGNAFDLQITKGKVTIECEFSLEYGIAEMTVEDFRKWLTIWRDFLISIGR